MKKSVILIASLVLISSCAHTIEVTQCLPDTYLFNFFGGLLHGFISPITFIISLFNNDVTVFAVNNTGHEYVLGFLLGTGSFSITIVKTTKKSNPQT